MHFPRAAPLAIAVLLFAACPQVRPPEQGTDDASVGAVSDAGNGSAVRALTLIGLDPPQGSTVGGTRLVVSGTGMRAGLGVTLQGRVPADVTLIGDATIIFTTTAGTAGGADITVTNPDGQTASLAGAFTYIAPTPTTLTVTGAVPNVAGTAGGDAVILVGTGFEPGVMAFFGDEPAASTEILSDGTLLVTTPVPDSEQVTVSVENAAGARASLDEPFRFIEGALGVEQPLTVESVLPALGPIAGQTRVAVVGTGFRRDVTVQFGGAAASGTADYRSPQVVVVTTPPGAAGAVDVTVSQDGGSVTLDGGFTYFDSARSLSLTGMLPASGPIAGGTPVALIGTGFESGMVVTIGSSAATDVVVSSESVATANAPAGAAGTVDVTIALNGDTASLPGAFTYVDPAVPLSLSAIGPDRGPIGGGTRVVVTGSGLPAVETVTFGAAAAEIVERISPEAIVVATPAAAAAGRVDVTAQATGGASASLAGAFEYHLPEAVPIEPELVGVMPRTGPTTGGTRTAVHGRGITGVVGIKVGNASAANVTALDSTVIAFTTPPGAAGPADVTALLSGGRQLILRRAFFYFSPTSSVPEPSARQITPSVGPVSGGTRFVIAGSRFQPGARILIDGEEALDVTHVNSTMLTGVTPAGGRTGAVDIAVFHVDGKVSLLAGGFRYFQPDASLATPRIDEIRPPTASSLGGTVVTLIGSSFHDGATVMVGQLPGTEVVVASSTRVTFRAPAHAPGPATVSLANPDGAHFEVVNGLTYQAEPPTIDVVMPAEGPANGGTGLSIRGAGFGSGATVLVGNNAANDVLVLDPTLILAVTPPGIAGDVDVTVVNPGNLSATATNAFHYTPGDYPEAAPLLTSITPARGPFAGGTRVSIAGENLRDGGQLLIGNTPATEVAVATASQATAITPPGLPGAVDVAWMNADGQASILRAAFTYEDAAGPEPLLSGIAPSRAPEAGGTPVVLAGSGFAPGMLVFFGSTPAQSVVVLSGGFASLTTPAHEPGMVDVSVTTSDGHTVQLANAFTFVPSPRITGASPQVGPLAGGTRVLIGGENFQAGATVTFGALAAASTEVMSATVIAAVTSAALAPMRVDVKVRNPDGQQVLLAGAFEYLDLPTLASIWPASGPATGGTRTLLSGTGFRSGATVEFGGVPATGVVWLSDTSISAIVPAGAEGSADVTVVNPDGQRASLQGAFTRVDRSSLGSAATVSSCSPAVGHVDGGTAGNVTGTDFTSGARAFFGGAPALTGFMSATSLAIRTPAHAAGVVQVEVTLPNGLTSARPSCFEYRTDLGTAQAPILSSIQPAAGPTSGGADIVVTGDHFVSGAVLLVGNRMASSISVISPTRIEARTPAGDVGSADVAVANPDGQTVTLQGGYTYLAPPVLLSVTPSEGPSVGGTRVTVTGAGFLVGAGVRVGSVQATDVTVVSAERIDATTPPGTPGVADVTVVNSDGQVGTLPAAFAYTPPPVVQSVSPTSGSTVGGEWVTVAGSGYRAGAGVDFGTQAATEVQVLSGTELRARTPAAPSGTVAVKVTNVDGYSDTLPLAFTYVPPPVILSISPTSGPEAGGTAVTIVGSGFQSGVQVIFGVTAAASVTFVNPGVLQVTTPSRPAGAAAVTVRNPDGQQAILPLGFVYFPPIPPPRVDAVSPNFGPIIGGGLASITGAAFQFGARVFFGDEEVPASQVNVLASTFIRVRVPAGAAEATVPVRVVNPDAQEHSLALGFTYLPALALPPLALHSISPNRSPLAGGVRASILGNGMSADVEFYVVQGATSVPVPIVQYFSPVAVQVQLPPVSSPGQYDLRAVLPSTGDQVSLAQAIVYQDLNVTFAMRRGRLPSEIRGADAWPVVADFNKDGFNDVFVLRGNSRSAYLQNRGGAQPGYFDDVTAAALTGESDNDWSDNASSPLVADFTLDGWPDILTWRGYGNDLNIWMSRGNGTLAAGGAWNLGGCVNDWVVADLDGHDGPDVFSCSCGANTWLRNRGVRADGDGNLVLDGEGRPIWRGFEGVTFTAVVNGEPRTPNEDTRGCDIGDLDNDGDMDVLLANAFNIASRVYLSDASARGVEDERGLFEDFAADNWNESQISGSVSSGVYRAQLTDVSDPFFYRDTPDFDEQYNRLRVRYRSYANGPSSLKLYYIDYQDCGGWTDDCSQSFPLVSDGAWQTLDVGITDAEWINENRDIYQLRFDFEGATATGTVEIEDLTFYRSVKRPSFVDVSGSPMFNYSSDSRAARMADVDHDGRLDLVFINWNQDDFILFNRQDTNGNQIFVKDTRAICHDEECRTSASSPPFYSQDTTVSVGADRHARVAGDAADGAQKFLDINRDGCIDLLIWFSGQSFLPRFYLNKKIGAAPQGCTGQFFYTPTTSSDVTNPLRGLYQGTTGTEVGGIFGNDYRADWGDHAAVLGDFDNDGWLDMYQSIAGQQDRVYLRRPVVEDGQTYQRLIDVTYEGVMPRDMDYCYRARPLDVNRDGAMDIVYTTWSDCQNRDPVASNRVLINDGAGNFIDESDRIPYNRSRSTELVVDDFNGDGFEDLLYLNRSSYYCTQREQILLYQNDGTGHFTDVSTLANLGGAGYEYGGFTSALSHDLDGDGDKDLVMFGNSNYGNRRMYLNGGDPLGRNAPYFFDVTSNLPNYDGSSATVLDFNRDGKPDLYVSRSGQNRLMLNEGGARFTDVTGIYMNQVSDGSDYALAARWSGSSYTDIFVSNSTQSRRIHVARADGTLADLTDSNMRMGSDGRTSHHGYALDLNEDGLLDVVAAGWSGRPMYYINVGNAVFEDRSLEVFTDYLGEQTTDIAIADYDNDGDADVFLCNYGQQNRLLVNMQP